MISIVIPAYNAAPFLEETLNSVINQNYNDFELFVVIDGATDSTEEIARGFESDSRVKVISKPNSGVSDTRNRGFHASKGNYIAFLDADDVWLPTRLEVMLKAFAENQDAGLVHTDMAVIDELSKKTGEVFQGKEGWILNSLLSWNGTNIPAPSSILVKREVVEKIGGFDTRLSTAADQEFFFRVAAEYRVVRVAEPLGLYRVHGGNMHQNIALMERDHIMAYKIARENKLFHSGAFRRKCFAKLYLILAGSWWNEGKSKRRGLNFLLRSFFTHPGPVIKRMLRRGK